jgi:hypothetical protein
MAGMRSRALLIRPPRRDSCIAALLLVAGAIGVSGEAEAQSPTDPALAEALFQEGRKLMDQKKYAEACPKFAESQRLDPGIGTLLNLASCHELEGKTATAWAEFTQATGLAAREGRPAAGQFARTHIDAITPKLAKITISVPPESQASGLEVRLDQQLIGQPAWGIAAPIDPGTHQVTAVAPGKRRWSTGVVFGPSEAKTVQVPVLEAELEEGALPPDAGVPVPAPSASAPPPAPLPPAAPPPSASEGTGEGQRMAGVITAGAGVLGVGASFVLGFLAKSKYDDAGPFCDASGCEPRGLELRHSAVTRGEVATVMFGVGALAMAGGAVLWLTAPKAPSHPAVGVGVTREGIVARGAW